ncbi:MAG: hypothetical protein J6Z12_00075 [Paludibacteraceae bacterium]|nr:hypothetical protein [Paludibacteraceae bacterium]
MKKMIMLAAAAAMAFAFSSCDDGAEHCWDVVEEVSVMGVKASEHVYYEWATKAQMKDEYDKSSSNVGGLASAKVKYTKAADSNCEGADEGNTIFY